MKKSTKYSSILTVAILCAAMAGSTAAVAQQVSTDPPPNQQPPDTTTQSSQPQVVTRCSKLIGTTVRNQQGQKLGKIADVVVSFDKEHVSYCVMSVNRGIFAKTRFLAVPLAAFQPSEDGSYLTLSASRANLANAGGFDRNDWPSAITPAWGAEPAGPEQLPPVTVFAPTETPVPAPAYPSAADPAMGPSSRQTQSLAQATEAFQFQLGFGYILSEH